MKVGGLSQVMYFLPRSLKKLGHDVRIFTPLYGSSRGLENKKLKMRLAQLNVPVNGKDNGFLICNVKYLAGDEKTASVYFLENREYYELRANAFGYADDHIRFALLCKACLEWLIKEKKKCAKGWWPDVIHCHDWHASYFIDLAKNTERYNKIIDKTPVLLTVHNFKYQGNWDFKYVPKEQQDNGFSKLASLTSPELQKQNALKRGLLFADAITTVSPQHALEVLTPEYAEGLEDAICQVRGKLSGILNGINVDEFNPWKDQSLKKRFSKKKFIKARAINKADLQNEFGLQIDPHKPLLAFVGRLTTQKGLDLVIEALSHLLEEHKDIQYISLGSGDERFKNALIDLKKKFPEQIALHLSSDFNLPRKIFAGADIILMPSAFEPGGIVALEAQRYGAVPLVRKTGGLVDIVNDFDPVSKKGNGFSFTQKTPWALYDTIIRALTIYKQKKIWYALVKNCLSQDFSWDHAAKEYEDWYLHNIKKRSQISLIYSIWRKIIKENGIKKSK